MRKIYTNFYLYALLACIGVVGTGMTAKAQYCLPTYNSACTSGDFINDVSFVTISNLSSGCGLTSANYSDYTSTINTTVSPGNSYPITVTPGPQWGQYFVAFIDLNIDGDFADPGEFFDIGYALAGQTISNTIAIPGAATVGTTRFRVMCRYASTPLTPNDSCASGLSFGEVEDYTLTIIPPPPIDLAAVSVDSPLSSCVLDTAEHLSVTFANYGLNNIPSGIQLCYSVNNGPAVCEPFTGTVNAGDSASYTFISPIDMSTPGPYNIQFWTSVASDGNATNDTLNGVTISNLGTGLTQSVPYFEDFESGNGNWSTYGGPPNSWAHGQPNSTFITSAASGLNAWVTNLTGQYQNSELSFLQSPCLDFSGLTGDPFIAFSHIYNTESCCDEGWLELSTDAGATWAKVGTAGSGNNWYNDTFADEWDGDSGPGGQWRTADNQLVGAAGNAGVFVRFVFSSDGSVLADGFGVDNVRILDTIINAAVSAINSPMNSCLMDTAETIEIELYNAGTHIATNFDVCFTVDGGIPVCETITDTIQPGASYTYTFTGTGDFSTTGLHDLVTYTTLAGDSITDNDTSALQITNYPVINTFPHVQDFEGGQNNWATDGTNNDWEWGLPNKLNISGAASGSGAWVTGTTGFLNHNSDQDSWVESPCFDLTSLSNPWVGSQVWWESNFSSDGTVLEYSTDAGATWAEVGTFNDPYNWYNDNAINGLTNANLSGNGWSGNGTSGSGGYVMAKSDVSFLTGQSLVRFRMHFGSDGFGNADGFAFDDFTLANPPAVDLGGDTIVCESLTLTPGLPTNGTFQWDSLVTGFSVTVDTTPSFTINASGTYILTYTDSLGLCGMDTVEVTINTTPVVDLGPDQNICMNSSTTLSVDSLAYPSVNWSTSATSPSITVTTATTIIVDVTDTVGCTSSDTINTAIVPLPQFTLGPDTTVCQGDSFCLGSGITGPGYNYLWSTGATTETICSSIVAGYWAIVIDSNGCEWADSIILTAAAPAPTASASFDTSNCPIVAFSDLSSGTINNWMWDFGDGNSSSAASPSNDYSAAGNGTYTVLFIVDNACGADTTTLQVDINCLVNISSALDAQLKIFPNPNQGRFRVVTELPGTVPVNLEITDIRGQVVFERNYGDASGLFEEEIQLDQAAGVYFIRFEAGDEVAVEKLIVE